MALKAYQHNKLIARGSSILRARRFLGVRRFVQKFLDDRALALAGLLAWGLLNTLLPLFIGVLSLATLLLGDVPRIAEMQAALISSLPPQAANVFNAAIESARAAAGAASLISLGILLFMASNFFTSMEGVFDLAYHVPERDLVRQRVLSLVALLLVTAAVLVATVFSSFGALASVVGVLCVMLILYMLVPNKRIRWREAAPGAVLASVLFVAALQLFPLYVQLFGQGFTVYAAFGAVLLFAFWLYLVGVILMLGIELNAFLVAPRRSSYLSAVYALAANGQLQLGRGRRKTTGGSVPTQLPPVS